MNWRILQVEGVKRQGAAKQRMCSLTFPERNLHPDICQRHLEIAFERRLLQHIPDDALIFFSAEAMQRRDSISKPANQKPVFLVQFSSIGRVAEYLRASIIYPGFAAGFENTIAFVEHQAWRLPMM